MAPKKSQKKEKKVAKSKRRQPKQGESASASAGDGAGLGAAATAVGDAAFPKAEALRFFDLALKYADGDGVEQSDAEAARCVNEGRRLLELSAARGDASAFGILGQVYETGLGVEKNLALAKQYFRRAGKQNDDSVLASGKTTQEHVTEFLDTIKHTCASCKTVGDGFKVCTRCKGPRYCSVVCQKKDWPEHKRVCQRLAETEALDRMAQDANDC